MITLQPTALSATTPQIPAQHTFKHALDRSEGRFQEITHACLHSNGHNGHNDKHMAIQEQQRQRPSLILASFDCQALCSTGRSFVNHAAPRTTNSHLHCTLANPKTSYRSDHQQNVHSTCRRYQNPTSAHPRGRHRHLTKRAQAPTSISANVANHSNHLGQMTDATVHSYNYHHKHVCQYCGIFIGTPEHTVLQCPTFQVQRSILPDGKPCLIHDIDWGHLLPALRIEILPEMGANTERCPLFSTLEGQWPTPTTQPQTDFTTLHRGGSAALGSPHQ